MKRPITTVLVLVLVMAMSVMSVSAVLVETPASAAQDVCGASYNFSAVVETAASIANVSFYDNTTGAMTAICSRNNETTPAIEDGASYSCSGDTTALSDGAATIVARAFDTNGGSEVEINTTAVGEIDNTGPVLTFTSTNNDDNDKVDECTSFNISLTTDEAMVGTPYVSLAGKRFNLKNTSLTAWYYNFDRDDFADGTYRYIITAGTDNTSCANTGSGLDRYITVGRTSSAKAGHLAEKYGSDTVEEQERKTGNRQRMLALAAVAVIIYLLFIHKKKR